MASVIICPICFDCDVSKRKCEACEGRGQAVDITPVYSK